MRSSTTLLEFSSAIVKHGFYVKIFTDGSCEVEAPPPETKTFKVVYKGKTIFEAMARALQGERSRLGLSPELERLASTDTEQE